MADPPTQTRARAGDRVEVRSPDGSVRRGVIVDVLGEPAHVHFQVQWNASHESMVFPGEDVVVIPSGDGRDGAGRDGDGDR